MASEDPTVTSTERAEIADTIPGEARGDALVGSVLGHFRIDALLGEGGMGVVYRAFDLTLERPVALKLVTIDSPTARARFLREARAQARVRHVNVVQVYEVDQVGAITYLVMDLVEGESLKSVIAREGRLPEGRALEIALAIASALEAALAHGIVHRDVKPGNVLVERSGHVRLADFGIAKLVRAAGDDDTGPPAPESAAPRSLTAPGAGIGTPAYAAPEQMRGEPVDHRADMYALGVTMHEMLTGARPHGAADGVPTAPLTELVPGIREETAALVARLLASDPASRPASHAEVVSAIEAARRERLPLAPRWMRVVAWPIDAVIFLFVAGLVVGLARKTGLGAVIEGWPVVLQKQLMWILGPILFAVAEIALGRTPMKALFGLRDVDLQGDAPPLGRRALRALVKSSLLFAIPLTTALPKVWPATRGLTMLPYLALNVTFLVTLLGAHRRSLHDRVAGTRVVRGARGAA